ncbi:ATP-binding cassette domain-containing protein [Pantoea ananatis]|uniref:ATP-binding cassette domain-containing protein n=1 Tax=Pantoea ananas TaxID=553 RepID=UPI00221E3FC0|nr:ATP-binding cassette domain-containing protein [Pantoea ananatis]
MKPKVRTEQVETHALRSLDLHVREGEFVAVTGPSGSGKTTFLNIAGLLETFTSGQYLLDGQATRCALACATRRSVSSSRAST